MEVADEEKKSRKIWPWILAVVVVLMAIGIFLFIKINMVSPRDRFSKAIFQEQYLVKSFQDTVKQASKTSEKNFTVEFNPTFLKAMELPLDDTVKSVMLRGMMTNDTGDFDGYWEWVVNEEALISRRSD